MRVATSDSPPSAAKRTRSRLWFVVTTVVPTLLMVGGGLWLTLNLVRYQQMVPGLQASVSQAQGDLQKTISERDVARAELEATRVDLARTRAEHDDLVQSNIDLKAQNEKLLVALANPDAPDAIAKVRGALKDLSAHQRAEALYERGKELFGLGQADASGRFLVAACEEDPKFYQPRIELGFQAARRSDFKEAEHWYLEAEKADPRSPYPAYTLMNLYFMLGKLDKAAAYADRVRAMPDRPHKQMDDLLMKVDAATATMPH